MSPEERERKKEREKNAIYSGHLRLCQQPRAAHTLHSDQKIMLGDSKVWCLLILMTEKVTRFNMERHWSEVPHMYEEKFN
jgi:hypothetical protein